MAEASCRSDAVLARLMELHPKKIDLSLDRLTRLLGLLGNPERKLPPVIHVAGTNGKGSTVAYMRAMLEAAGKRVHVYTSPHLVKFHERIRLAGTLISEEHLTAMLERCEAANGDAPITFFEVTTAAAFLAFSETEADICLLEVGLGGRLDATNVVPNPLATVITPISIDHEAFLGNTIEAIAGEKAGILKQGCIHFQATQDPRARNVLAKHIEDVKVGQAFIQGVEWTCQPRGDRLAYRDIGGQLDLPKPTLQGNHQAINAGLAVAVMRHLPELQVHDKDIEAGLVNAFWPARMQKLEPGPLLEKIPETMAVFLDGGHNPAAAISIAQSLEAMGLAGDEAVMDMVIGMLNVKDMVGFLSPLQPLVRRLYTVAIPGEENSCSAEELAAIAAPLGFDVRPMPSLKTAIDLCGEHPAPADSLLIGGSLYLAGEVLAANGCEVA